MRPSSRQRAVLAVALLAALASCGRKGPLELPPGAPQATDAKTADSKTADGKTAAADQPDDAAAFKNPVFKEEPAPRPINAAPAAAHTGFFLDPLL